MYLWQACDLKPIVCVVNELWECYTMTLMRSHCGDKQTGSGTCELHYGHAPSSIAHYKHCMVESIWVVPRNHV